MSDQKALKSSVAPHGYRFARRVGVLIVGGIVLLAGVAMIVLPGPAIVVIPLGLGILGLEFPWALRWLKHLKEKGAVLLARH